MTTTRDTPEGLGHPDGTEAVRLVVRVWLPDRPGALGLVASRIGAIGADIVGVDVLERSEHVAVDEFAVMLDDADLVKLLVREIEEVDGASVEQWERVERFPDPLDALETMEHVCSASDLKDLANRLADARARRVQRRLGRGARRLDGIARGRRRRRARAVGAVRIREPVPSASPAVAAGDSGPDDLAVAPLAEARRVPARRSGRPSVPAARTPPAARARARRRSRERDARLTARCRCGAAVP